MIAGGIGRREVLLQINQNCNKILERNWTSATRFHKKNNG